jgi:hypothetical protein
MTPEEREIIEDLVERIDAMEKALQWLEDQMFAMNRARTEEIDEVKIVFNTFLTDIAKQAKRQKRKEVNK